MFSGAYQSSTLERNVHFVDQHEAQSRRADENAIGDNLGSSVDPYGQPPGEQAHQDGSAREENHKGQRGQDSVYTTHVHGLSDVERGPAPKRAETIAVRVVRGAVEAAVEATGEELGLCSDGRGYNNSISILVFQTNSPSNE